MITSFLGQGEGGRGQLDREEEDSKRRPRDERLCAGRRTGAIVSARTLTVQRSAALRTGLSAEWPQSRRHAIIGRSARQRSSILQLHCIVEIAAGLALGHPGACTALLRLPWIIRRTYVHTYHPPPFDVLHRAARIAHPARSGELQHLPRAAALHNLRPRRTAPPATERGERLLPLGDGVAMRTIPPYHHRPATGRERGADGRTAGESCRAPPCRAACAVPPMW